MSRSTIRVRVAVATLVVAVASWAAAAQAGTMRLAVDSNQSTVSLKLNVLGGLISPTLGTVNLSGAMPPVPPVLPPATPNTLGYLGDIQALANVPGQLISYGAGAAGTNLGFSTGSIPFVGSLTLTLNVPVFAFETGTFLPSSAMAGMAQYDWSGLNFDINAGQLSYSGSGLLLGALGSGTINFGLNLFSTDLAAGTKAKLTLGAGPPSNQLVTLSVPVSSSAPLIPGLLDLAFTGNVVFTGVRVPEPSTWALMAMGLVALAPRLRRARR